MNRTYITMMMAICQYGKEGGEASAGSGQAAYSARLQNAAKNSKSLKVKI